MDSRQEGRGAACVMESREWYKDQYRKSLSIALLLAAVCLVQFVLLSGLVFFRTPPRYFAVTPDLRVLPVPSLEEPYITHAGLTNWAAEVVTRSIALNFLDWRRQLNDVRNCFTGKAFDNLLASYTSSGTLEAIRTKKLSTRATVEQAPVITDEKIVAGRRTWTIQVPIVVSYESSHGVEATQRLLAKLLVQRVPTTDNERGVQVVQLVYSPGGNG